MELEILHVAHGDKRKKFDTSTEAGRKEAAELIRTMLKGGTAIFLERGKKTYRVRDYDSATDAFITTVDKGGKQKIVKASSKKGRTTAVPPVQGGRQ